MILVETSFQSTLPLFSYWGYLLPWLYSYFVSGHLDHNFNVFYCRAFISLYDFCIRDESKLRCISSVMAFYKLEAQKGDLIPSLIDWGAIRQSESCSSSESMNQNRCDWTQIIRGLIQNPSPRIYQQLWREGLN